MSSPYLRLFMEGDEIQGRVLELLLRLSQVWAHHYAVSLVQEVEGGERVLLRRNTVTTPAERLHGELPSSTSRQDEQQGTCTSSLSGILSCASGSWKLLAGG